MIGSHSLTNLRTLTRCIHHFYILITSDDWHGRHTLLYNGPVVAYLRADWLIYCRVQNVSVSDAI